MIKYAKLIDEETGLCEVGLGNNKNFYQNIGMIELDVDKSEVDNNWYLLKKCPHKTTEEISQQEKERKSKLSLTKREVFLALYKYKGLTPDDVKNEILSKVEEEKQKEILIEFDYANEYYRGNPLIDKIGKLLGITEEQLDYLFEYGEIKGGSGNIN